tara:strand:- start:34 stop:543 length:510 start_codon:yes stop_codon:yes gene_type:complete
MKKLLALLLLSPLASANVWKDATETLNLEFLSRWFPNDTYIGIKCVGSNGSEREYRMMTLSIEEEKGINLLEYTHWDNDLSLDYWNKSSHEMHKNEKWSKVSIQDMYISIWDIGYSTIWRDTFEVNGIPCYKADKDDMKRFGYYVEKIYKKNQKLIDDNYQKKLDKRKL